MREDTGGRISASTIVDSTTLRKPQPSRQPIPGLPNRSVERKSFDTRGMDAVDEWARRRAGSEDGGKVVQHSLDVLKCRDVAVEDEVLYAGLDQCRPLGRSPSATMLGVAP